MKYTWENVPRDIPVWGCAYDVNNDNMHNYLRKEPVIGIVKGNGSNRYRTFDVFYELNKKGEIKKSSKVYVRSRQYADTYEECVELYNSLIDKALKDLEEVRKYHEQNKIEVL